MSSALAPSSRSAAAGTPASCPAWGRAWGRVWGRRKASITRRATSNTASDSWSRSRRRNSASGCCPMIASASSRALPLNSNARGGSAAIVSGSSNASVGAAAMATPFVAPKAPLTNPLEQCADPRSGHARRQQAVAARAEVSECRAVDEVDQRVRGKAVADPRAVGTAELFRAEAGLPLLHHDQRLEQVRVHEPRDVAERQPGPRQQPVVDVTGQVPADLLRPVPRGRTPRGRAAQQPTAAALTGAIAG